MADQRFQNELDDLRTQVRDLIDRVDRLEGKTVEKRREPNRKFVGNDPTTRPL